MPLAISASAEMRAISKRRLRIASDPGRFGLTSFNCHLGLRGACIDGRLHAGARIYATASLPQSIAAHTRELPQFIAPVPYEQRPANPKRRTLRRPDERRFYGPAACHGAPAPRTW